MELTDGMSVRQLLNQLNIGIDEPKILFINGVHARLDDLINDGDRVAIFPPIAGG
jgi:molybdopterin converting factor small subunit